MPNSTEASLQTAAQCWCDKETETKTMDVELATAFAKRLDAQKESQIVKLVSQSANMAADYKNTIKQTGSLLTSSMVYAYSKGLNDALKLLTKEDTNDKKTV